MEKLDPDFERGLYYSSLVKVTRTGCIEDTRQLF
jgi:hypothetical protein